jgi:hypothetical protein
MASTKFSSDIFSESKITFPAEEIRAMKDRLDQKKALLLDLPRQIAEDEARYNAALMFAPAGFDPHATEVAEKEAAPSAQPERRSWTVAMRAVLKDAPLGLTHAEAKEAALKLFPDLPQSDGLKGFYNAVKRLADQHQLAKHAGRMYDVGVFTDLVKRKALPSDAPKSPTGGQSGEIVMEIISKHPFGVTAAQLKAMLQQRDDATKSLKEHDSYMYGILEKLMKAKLIVKHNGIYRPLLKVEVMDAA